MEILDCINCSFYLQHYVKRGYDDYIAVNCGHCTNKSLNRNRSDSIINNKKNCEFFKRKDPDEQKFTDFTTKSAFKFILKRLENIETLLEKYIPPLG